MIPDIAIILAAYICFRMVEVWLFSPDRYRNAGSHTAAFILSLLVIAVTVLVLIMVLANGSSTPLMRYLP